MRGENPPEKNALQAVSAKPYIRISYSLISSFAGKKNLSARLAFSFPGQACGQADSYESIPAPASRRRDLRALRIGPPVCFSISASPGAGNSLFYCSLKQTRQRAVPGARRADDCGRVFLERGPKYAWFNYTHEC